ncbi:MAG TPA: hypothetical protein VEL74_08955 [Thermoanaerobaculia bacterium]|nr:hypothetical protein [Thermoanaerobaculia bacterium]
MRDRRDSTVVPSKVFSPEYLRWLAETTNEPRSASEGDLAGPWRIVPYEGNGYALLRQGERLRRDRRPPGLFSDLGTAQVAAAILPGVGRESLYRLRTEEKSLGYAIEGEGDVVGWLDIFHQDVTAAMHVVACLLRSPGALARVLQAASGLTLEHTAEILLERAQHPEAP